MKQSRSLDAALAAFRIHGGILKSSQALSNGVHPEALYKLLDEGRIVRLARGLYRLTSAKEFSNPDLAVVAVKAPGAVVCLISALAFHGITTQIPRAVQIAVSRRRYGGLRLTMPPVKVYRFNSDTFDLGVEVHAADDSSLRVYCVARTLVDCFRYRNKLGLDVAVEALRFARVRKRTSNREILKFARILRQERVMAPYLESIG